MGRTAIQSNGIYQIVPTNGGTVQIPDMPNSEICVMLKPAGLLLALTLVNPPNPQPGQIINIISSQAITVVTHQGGTILDGISALVANIGMRYAYNSNTDKWSKMA